MTRRRVDLEEASHLALVPGATLLHSDETVFEAMLEGWTRQMRSRMVSQGSSIEPRLRMVKRFAEFTDDSPMAVDAVGPRGLDVVAYLGRQTDRPFDSAELSDLSLDEIGRVFFLAEKS